MATFLRQGDCAGEPSANPNRLRDMDTFSISAISKIRCESQRPKTHFQLGQTAFKTFVVFCGAMEGPFCPLKIEKQGGTSL
jgi:hypothetical protein